MNPAQQKSGLTTASLNTRLDEERDNGGKKKLKAPKNVAKQWKSLPEEEKRPFQDAVKDAWKNHAKERGERPEAPKKKVCSSCQNV
uniref:HMG box domain-containing protein n=1 Tax=Salix viminalis TaxID=40686 RepID=A0A6N2NL99_SALVM